MQTHWTANNTSPIIITEVDLYETLPVTIECITNMLSEEPSASAIPPNLSVIGDAFDISTVDFAVAISDILKRKILMVRFEQTKSWKGPLKLGGEKQRRVPNIILDQNVYPYMPYGLKSDSCLFRICKVFNCSIYS